MLNAYVYDWMFQVKLSEGSYAQSTAGQELFYN